MASGPESHHSNHAIVQLYCRYGWLSASTLATSPFNS